MVARLAGIKKPLLLGRGDLRGEVREKGGTKRMSQQSPRDSFGLFPVSMYLCSRKTEARERQIKELWLFQVSNRNQLVVSLLYTFFYEATFS